MTDERRTPTEGELEALRAFLRAGSYQGAALELGIGERGVQSRLARLYLRLGVRSAREALIELGWLRIPE